MIGAFSFLNLKIAEIVKRLDKFGQLWLVGLITISGSFKNTSKQKIKLPDIVVCPARAAQILAAGRQKFLK